MEMMVVEVGHQHHYGETDKSEYALSDKIILAVVKIGERRRIARRIHHYYTYYYKSADQEKECHIHSESY